MEKINFLEAIVLWILFLGFVALALAIDFKNAQEKGGFIANVILYLILILIFYFF